MTEDWIEQFIEKVNKSVDDAAKAASPPTTPDGQPLIGKCHNPALGIEVEVTGDRSIRLLKLTEPVRKLNSSQLGTAILRTIQIANKNYDKLAQGQTLDETPGRMPSPHAKPQLHGHHEEDDEDDEYSGFDPNDPLGRKKQQGWY